MELDIKELWTAAGVLLGFEATSFGWRIAQESQVADRGDISWIPPADFLNLAAIVTTSCVFVLPIMGIGDNHLAVIFFGRGIILFVGHWFSLAGHYELFNRFTERSHKYFPLQERIAVFLTVAVAVGYVTLSLAVE